MTPPPPGRAALGVLRSPVIRPPAWSGLLLRLLLPLLAAAAAAQGYRRSGPRISFVWEGQDRVDFGQTEPHTVLFHEQDSSSVWVGGRGKVYHFDFPEGKNASMHKVKIPATSSSCKDSQDCENYITLLDRRDDELLICGTNARRPSCWNLVNGTLKPLGEKRGYAPFKPEDNTIVLFDGKEVYSTIQKQESRKNIPRFRRIEGENILYTSDTVMKNPKFIKATIVLQDQSYNDKIYCFFREDNPDKNPEAPLNVSRVAQLCRWDQGGESSMAASKWNTFLKALLVCSDATSTNFNRLQDVFVLPDPKGDWRNSKVFGIFSNSWNYSAICMYSFGDIDKVFRTSSLKGYNKPLPRPRPGQCLPNRGVVPTDTFHVADGHPEVSQRVEPFGPLKTPLFHSKCHYQKLVVHHMSDSIGTNFHVMYLTTDKGTIHKVVHSEDMKYDLVSNIMEIQPFRRPAAIKTITLDTDRRKLYVSSEWEISQVPLDLCEVYSGGCPGCLMAQDPYCGWFQDRCASIYTSRTHIVQPTDPAEPYKDCTNPKPDQAPLQKVSLPRHARYYLSCPMVSRHANYSWRHGKTVVQTCEPSYQSPNCEPSYQGANCILFIENFTPQQQGHYHCEAQEGSYLFEVQHWELLSDDGTTTAKYLMGCAQAPAISFCLGILPMVLLSLLVY
ncbi:PREDICTED: semaphorin-7A isoform X2 [Elephantulus edwardii]|uniref:semaphorin-7A isoform X2 n=1 Tax=Elephantulus edwardii TaxID=28737 RepID=UPI0003F05B7C|nr:PREDICTED: semaphorin-7A isoform X2 [Elephantulus edwardii]